MRVLLVSAYELGHQPLHVASPAAALRGAGHEVRCLDLAVEPWDPATIDWAGAVAFSVPMHTAMRLALHAARAVRDRRPELPVCFYGLYAPVSRDLTLGALADRVIAGEYEPPLVEWVDAVAAGGQPAGSVLRLGRGRERFELPARELLPPLDRYARLAVAGERRLVGYVEATHGCAHRCRHCPIPAVYDGAFRVVGRETVLADIEQLVQLGARHITFGDPDFLNGPAHARPVVQAMHASFPDLTFDCTVKIEHILRHEALWSELAAAGCLFVVTAIECLNDWLLGVLDKGHRAAEVVEALHLLRRHGIELRPSFLPFTPWTSLEDVTDILDFAVQHDLVDNVDPVQYTVRLLLPEGSLLLDRPELAAHLGPYDPEALTYTWSAADPAVDRLQTELSELVQAAAAVHATPEETFPAVVSCVRQATGAAWKGQIPAGSVSGRPRLTEPWFC
jgi:radical SAM superfamily enzyme YgiQ (UPF0313 family)